MFLAALSEYDQVLVQSDNEGIDEQGKEFSRLSIDFLLESNGGKQSIVPYDHHLSMVYELIYDRVLQPERVG